MEVWKGKHIVEFCYYKLFQQLQHQVTSGHISSFNGNSGEYQIQPVTYTLIIARKLGLKHGASLINKL